MATEATSELRNASTRGLVLLAAFAVSFERNVAVAAALELVVVDILAGNADCRLFVEEKGARVP